MPRATSSCASSESLPFARAAICLIDSPLNEGSAAYEETTANGQVLDAALGEHGPHVGADALPDRRIVEARADGDLPAFERPGRKADAKRRARRGVGVLIGLDADSARPPHRSSPAPSRPRPSVPGCRPSGCEIWMRQLPASPTRMVSSIAFSSSVPSLRMWEA